jgi:hypothetical protein
LLDRSCPTEGVRVEISRFASVRQELTIQLDGKPQRIPTTCAWAIVPLAACQLPADAIQQIDRFVAEHRTAG